jgi:hypothetical protein
MRCVREKRYCSSNAEHGKILIPFAGNGGPIFENLRARKILLFRLKAFRPCFRAYFRKLLKTKDEPFCKILF